MGNFIFTKTGIDGVVIVTPKVFTDSRGYFMETYEYNRFCEGGIEAVFVQDNQSASFKGVIRGLHMQKNHPQAKLVRVLSGEVFDVAVDVRKGSKTYGKWVGEVLSDKNKKQLFIPRGFLHGFAVLSEYAVFSYKCDDFYHPEDETGVIWNDPDIGIDWHYKGVPILSEKDKQRPLLKDADL